MKAWLICYCETVLVSWLAGGVRGRGRVVLIFGRAGRGRGVPVAISLRPVLAGCVLQLGGHGGRNLGVVGHHGLGKVLGARVETWRQRKSKKNTLGKVVETFTCFVSVPVHFVHLPVRPVVVVAAPHDGDLLVTDRPQLPLAHHVDLVLCLEHVVELRDGRRVQPGHLQDLVGRLVAVLRWWVVDWLRLVVDRLRSLVTSVTSIIVVVVVVVVSVASTSLSVEQVWAEC